MKHCGRILNPESNAVCSKPAKWKLLFQFYDEAMDNVTEPVSYCCDKHLELAIKDGAWYEPLMLSEGGK